MEILIGILACIGIFFLVRLLSRGLIRFSNWAYRVSDALNAFSESVKRASPPKASANKELLENLQKTKKAVESAAANRETNDQYLQRARKEIDDLTRSKKQ